MKRWLVLISGIGILVIGIFWWQRDAQDATAVTASVTSFLSEEDVAGFAQATEPGAIEFPRDLGAHEQYQTEWWYYTGNLETENGREFGYQFTIFRRALTPQSPITDTLSEESEWRSNQVYFAHFTLSDIETETFYEAEKFSRDGVALAGATAVPYRVWIENWSAEEIAPDVVRLTAHTEEMALDIELSQSREPVLQGEAGLSQKGPEVGNASYYYSFVQQPTTGQITLGGEQFQVNGVSWKDHEYSTSALSGEAVGWDWFSIQLDDGTAVMLGQLRLADGSRSPFSAGMFVSAEGETRPLTANDFEITVTDTWTSDTSGAEYPAGWNIDIPSENLALTAVPLMPNQELNLSTVYWEGAVAYEGTLNDEPINGRGYVELTGYANSMQGRI